ncbi:hypothetical protein KIV63_gp09 [Mycobacterium phage SWU2]|uniref:Uncharacterized protein n=1 Tax=Mycobacterium phage SWU2 TaxID=2077150 RepID=A0A2K9VIG8_9CAUD|nr:hypothetical protein KIV63_gp09 [Mycobacterium phage SWU2]AUV62035.1 hypothetical protein JX_gp76 [Mycobacterium phage SWU2]
MARIDVTTDEIKALRAAEIKAAAYDALMAELTEVTSHLAAYADSYEESLRNKPEDTWYQGKAQAYRVAYDKVYAVLTASQRGEL